ncbi:unnamed protein product [Pseudo-nitzschia multistriata]|uniref:Uncharacterized protein n=1 Tax=Pseudo-nitzschia multistriata TaxID=183589 RepID=A0A448YWC1_9STRA|nr:unnamed protein product [Pseudo-nitzschia multistriata]
MDKKECPASAWFAAMNRKTRDRESNTYILKEPKLTVLILYYNDDRLLAHQLDSWINYSEEVLSRIRFVIIDDGSIVGHRAKEFLELNVHNKSDNLDNESTTTSIEETNIQRMKSNHSNADEKNHYGSEASNVTSLDIRIYEIDQDIDWNVGGARNLGFWIVSQNYGESFNAETSGHKIKPVRNSTSPWVFMNDADVLVPLETMEFVLGLMEKKSNLSADSASSVSVGAKSHFPESDAYMNETNPVYANFQRIGRKGKLKNKYPHPAVMLTTTDSYWAAGGCDEDFVGNYGWTDPHFFYRANESPSLEVVSIHKRMDKFSIPPLVEMSKKYEKSCPETLSCLPLPAEHKPKTKKKRKDRSSDKRDNEEKYFTKPKLSKNNTINNELYIHKTTEGDWSDKYLRFTWRRVW